MRSFDTYAGRRIAQRLCDGVAQLGALQPAEGAHGEPAQLWLRRMRRAQQDGKLLRRARARIFGRGHLLPFAGMLAQRIDWLLCVRSFAEAEQGSGKKAEPCRCHGSIL